MTVSDVREHVQWDNAVEDQKKLSMCLGQHKVNKCLWNYTAGIFDLFICFIINCDGQ